MKSLPRTTRRILGGAASLLAATACGSPTPTGPEPGPGPPPLEADDTTAVELDLRVVFQTVDGFGTTVPPLVYPTGDYLGALRPRAMEAAYGEVGLSLGTVSPGLVEAPADATNPFAERGNDNEDPFTVRMEGFNFQDLETVRSDVLVPARAAGSPELLLGPLLDLRGRHAWMADIRTQDYDRYLDEAAEHVLVVLQRWRDINGGPPSLVHLLNEPTSGARSLATRSVQEVVDVVKRVGQRLRNEGFDQVRFLVPNEESPARTLQVAEAILSDPVARDFVGAIGYHPYPYDSPYSSVRRIMEASGEGSPNQAALAEMAQLSELADRYGVPLWLTEVSEGPGRNDFPFGAVENLLGRAIHIHDNFVYSGATAFFGMLAIWDSRSHSEHFSSNIPFLSEHGHAVLVDVDAGEVMVTGMGHAIGHYARWLRPGATRVAASSADPRVLVSGFRSAGGGEAVLVVVNNTPRSQLVRASLAGGAASGAFTGETSTAEERWAPLGSIEPFSPSEIRFVAPPRSVTTVSVPLG